MKSFNILLTLALIVPVLSCSAQGKKVDEKVAPSSKIEAYYFHFNSRCVTCKTVEAQAKENLAVLCPEQMKAGTITFQSINLDDASSTAIAEKLKVSGQSLLLVKGAAQINITNEGFMYARSNPDKFKEIIKQKVDGMLK
ncbi:nitrophenyl compound nitroreductase subunit ArsF family protein [Williamwhitmania taraxaci]|uniref:Thioredoxin domain-containing protein n=1 Tax=Williamwhitmania taraxaci TaxID=1640674 RepID=A0A1G6LRS8_9BACT|nr:nitrophenyl compound nitroreductase subunit ArsF family protein [Williamwhitmania taraxaci]SDC45891.1 hypothetical protein SAMN05216323_103233 [Williamwhitmania taraxaci]